MGTMFYKDVGYGGGSESTYIVRQVTASAGTQIYIPASGTDSRIKTTGCEIKVVSQKKSDGTPYKFKSVQIYDGYAIITLGEALSGVYMGVKVTKNGYNVNDLVPMEYEVGWKTLATAAANQTWKAQLEYLRTYFQALDGNSRLSCALKIGSGIGWAVCSIIDISTGGFFRTNIACTVVVYYLNYGGEGKYINNGSDQSSSINSEPLSLVQLDN